MLANEATLGLSHGPIKNGVKCGFWLEIVL